MRLLRRVGPFRYLLLRRRRKHRAYQLGARWIYDQSVLSGIGLYVTVWAGVERMLNQFIVAYHPHRTSKLREKMPTDLESKIKYLAEVAKDPRLSKENSDRIRGWAKRLNNESAFRHMIVHGYGFRRRLIGNLSWTFQMLDVRGDSPKIVEKSYPNEEMQGRLSEIHSLSRDIANLLTPILFPQISSVSRP